MFEVRRGDEGIISLVGELDLAAAERFLVWVNALDGHRDVVLECSELTFIDSSGIRALLTVVSQTSGHVIVRAALPNVRKVLEVTGVNETVGVTVEG